MIVSRIHRIRHGRRWRWQLIEHRSQFLLQPRMQHRIGRGGDALGPQLAAAWAKQGQQLGRAIAHVFMGLAPRLALFGPALPRHGAGRIGPGLILRPYRQAQLLALAVGTLDQIFFWPRYRGL